MGRFINNWWHFLQLFWMLEIISTSKSIWTEALTQVHTQRRKWSWRLLPKPYIFHCRSFPSSTTSRMFLAFFKWPRSSCVLWGITEYQSAFVTPCSSLLGFLGGSDDKESACNAGDLSSSLWRPWPLWLQRRQIWRTEATPLRTVSSAVECAICQNFAGDLWTFELIPLNS